MRWTLPEDDAREAEALAAHLSLHPVCARVLVGRGFSIETAAGLFEDRLADLPEPSLMAGMDTAVERLERALRAGERVTLYGDYDVDGVTATAILANFLRACGGNVATYIPNRLDEGYGVNPAAVDRIAAGGTTLLVCLDCGICAVSEVDQARARGMEVLVVDHHQPGERLPRALAILDPHQPGCRFPSKDLCAAGLAFFVAVALRRRLREAGFFQGRPQPNLREYLDLAALGTVADVVPLVGPNRILVRHGLRELSRGARPGVEALLRVAGLEPGAPLTSGQVAFRLAPRINAAGRLSDAAAGLELLTTADPARAHALAGQLDAANAERQSIEKRIVEEAMAQAVALGGGQARGLVVAGDGWHPGVIGIVAARLAESFHRPTVVISLEGNEGRGSGRSIEGFHLFQALQDCAGHLTRFGGHRHAAGLSLRRSELPAFAAAFDRLARERITEEHLVARCRVDALVRPEEIDETLAEALQRLAPFGAGNPEPVLASLGLSARPRVLAAKKGGAGHLKLTLEGARHLDVIGFGLEEYAPLAAEQFDAAFCVAVDEWNGSRRVGLRLRDLRRAG